ncbi:tRNA/rRNA methyltransferase [Geothermobacter ehrlichii]|uniref:tRNA (cytidine/uridine-2'-O-)-methyltransferase TrmJ n=1 Tax=Geothermobacter ehrlichii TaxID=213224 RepID=A0A5D3WHL0_9BACT|nr:RNA methyltransferase [Geothermobacter ehrlichii]TYO96698.1 tRNA/rRNA methyltransferase [Geothermobacter ehrlichii]
MLKRLSQHLAVVLVEPQQPGNIGMVCRAMANFGIRDLRLVNPCQYLHPEARKFAVAGHSLLGDAATFSDLAAALADVHLAVAATRRGGRLRGTLHPSCMLPDLVAELPPGGKAALVFGREDHGLTNEELALCTAGVRIPSSEDVGSLNLAQAVLALLYELHRQPAPAAVPAPAADLPEHAELEAMFRQMEEVLDRVGFSNPACPGATFFRLRRLLARARPDREELALLRGLWRQLAESVNDWPGRRRGEGPRKG